MFPSTLVHEIPIWTFLLHFWAYGITTGGQNFRIMREWFQKQILHLKFLFAIDFHLSITIGTWNTSLGPFWVNDITMEVKTAMFWEIDLRNKLLTSKFHQILISVFLLSLIHDIQLLTLSTQFGGNGVTKEINIPEFWKIN